MFDIWTWREAAVAAQCSPGDRMVATGNWGCDVRLIDVPSGETRILSRYRTTVEGVASVQIMNRCFAWDVAKFEAR